jgi:hypothetical protein
LYKEQIGFTYSEEIGNDDLTAEDFHEMRDIIDNNTDLSNFKSEIIYPLASSGIDDQTVDNAVDLREYYLGDYAHKYAPPGTHKSPYGNKKKLMFQVTDSKLILPEHSFQSLEQESFIWATTDTSSKNILESENAENKSNNDLSKFSIRKNETLDTILGDEDNVNGGDVNEGDVGEGYVSEGYVDEGYLGEG